MSLEGSYNDSYRSHRKKTIILKHSIAEQLNRKIHDLAGDISNSIYEFYDEYFFCIDQNKPLSYVSCMIAIIDLMICSSFLALIMDIINFFRPLHWSIPSSPCWRYSVILRHLFAMIHYLFARYLASYLRSGMASYTRAAMFMLHVFVLNCVIFLKMMISSVDYSFLKMKNNCKYFNMSFLYIFSDLYVFSQQAISSRLYFIGHFCRS